MAPKRPRKKLGARLVLAKVGVLSTSTSSSIVSDAASGSTSASTTVSPFLSCCSLWDIVASLAFLLSFFSAARFSASAALMILFMPGEKYFPGLKDDNRDRVGLTGSTNGVCTTYSSAERSELLRSNIGFDESIEILAWDAELLRNEVTRDGEVLRNEVTRFNRFLWCASRRGDALSCVELKNEALRSTLAAAARDWRVFRWRTRSASRRLRNGATFIARMDMR